MGGGLRQLLEPRPYLPRRTRPEEEQEKQGGGEEGGTEGAGGELAGEEGGASGAGGGSGDGVGEAGDEGGVKSEGGIKSEGGAELAEVAEASAAAAEGADDAEELVTPAPHRAHTVHSPRAHATRTPCEYSTPAIPCDPHAAPRACAPPPTLRPHYPVPPSHSRHHSRQQPPAIDENTGLGAWTVVESEPEPEPEPEPVSGREANAGRAARFQKPSAHG